MPLGSVHCLSFPFKALWEEFKKILQMKCDDLFSVQKCPLRNGYLYRYYYIMEFWKILNNTEDQTLIWTSVEVYFIWIHCEMSDSCCKFVSWVSVKNLSPPKKRKKYLFCKSLPYPYEKQYLLNYITQYYKQIVLYIHTGIFQIWYLVFVQQLLKNGLLLGIF